MVSPKTLSGPTASDWVDWPPSYPDQPSVNQRASLPFLGAIWLRRSFLAALIALTPLVALSPARAQTVRITSDSGGNVQNYASYYQSLHERGSRIEIVGYCGSSCTLALRYDNVCVGPHALLGFHSSYFPLFIWFGPRLFEMPNETAFMWASYPAGVRAWLAARGGLTPQMKYIRGADLDVAKLVRCP